MSEKTLATKLNVAQEKTTAIGANINNINSELASLANVLRKYGDSNEIQILINENDKLKYDIEQSKQELFLSEIWNGVKQYQLPQTTNKLKNELTATQPEIIKPEKSNTNDTKKEKKKINSEIKPLNMPNQNEEEKYISQMLFKIGTIKMIEKHPDADSLYVEQIDLGEESPRTIISGLVAHFKPEELVNKMVVVMCNLKPLKMRGILSQGMVMCAVVADKLEILEPPIGSMPGDKITFPDIPTLEHYKEVKKDVFAKVAPHLRTNDECIAMYKDKPFTIIAKGVVKSLSLKGAEIR